MYDNTYNNTYNGYTNFATWLVAAWIDDNEWQHNYFRLKTTEIKSRVPDKDYQIIELENKLRDYLRVNMPVLKNGINDINYIYSDLLYTALFQVQFNEIACKLLNE